MAALLGAGCAATVPGTPVAGDGVSRGEVDPFFVHGTDGGPTDRLAASTVTDVLQFWRQRFEPTFGKPWRDLRGGFYSVDTNSRTARPAPCTSKAAEVEGNAFYCPGEDAIAWDRAALLPVLREEFGDAAVVVVLAHELGHAVHHRAGIGVAEQREQPQRYPTILTEAMADCYAGAFVRWVSDGQAPHLRITGEQLDSALGALITFRDPVGTSRADSGAHGNAFDRVSAFQDGFRQGPKLCAGMTVHNRTFTQTSFASFEDRATGGNLDFGRIVESVGDDLDGYFASLLSERGKAWEKPTIRATRGVPGCEGGRQGPVAFCPNTRSIELDTSDILPELHKQIGDYATGTLLASRYGMASLVALGRRADGDDAGRTALCLAGAYTGAIAARREGFGLSPGDLDEAVQVLLADDYASRDLWGRGIDSGFDRVDVFRDGALNGPKACGLN
ncbi:aminopeptidase [Longimycelium tulufanense]|uniref:Aminopeptidase n=1 Tax=Longimycelium tulufanense TaxID=907463 RepID=A0A8J3C5Z6_9PSEU|nr:aminopeptidase [Longimycelium tulufanense]